MTTWICIVCGRVYAESAGWPAQGSAAGTPWSEVPDAWRGPDCAVSKSAFDLQER